MKKKSNTEDFPNRVFSSPYKSINNHLSAFLRHKMACLCLQVIYRRIWLSKLHTFLKYY